MMPTPADVSLAGPAEFLSASLVLPNVVLAAIVVLTLGGLGAAIFGVGTGWLHRVAASALMASLIAAIAAIPLAIAGADLALVWRGPVGSGAGVSLDGLAISMVLLVSGLGAVVVRYAATMFANHPRQADFVSRLMLTLAAVLTTVVADNLAQIVVGLLGTALMLPRLLAFYSDRPAARSSARARMLVDAGLLIALVGVGALAVLGFGTLHVAELAALAEAAPRALVIAMASLVVIAALLASAQLPTHGWLVDGMDTPTPVSALLHAGVVNAGGFLLLRWAGFLSAAPEALVGLAIVAGISVVIAALVSATQATAKGQLAWSTVMQMGFMLVQIGLGAFSLAWLHLLAHACYKANAFLTAGQLPQRWTAPAMAGQPRLAAFATALLIAAAVVVGLSLLAGHSHPGSVVLSAVVVLGVASLLVQRPDADSWAARGGGVGLAAVIVLLVHGLHWLTGWMATGVLVADLPATPVPSVVALLFILGLASVAVIHHLALHQALSPRWQRLRTHLANGLYLGSLSRGGLQP